MRAPSCAARAAGPGSGQASRASGWSFHSVREKLLSSGRRRELESSVPHFLSTTSGCPGRPERNALDISPLRKLLISGL